MTDPGAILAHQGGWDEALLVLAPVLVFVTLLWVANRREQDRHRSDPGPPAPPTDLVD